MNPGAVEEGGQTARGIVDALKAQPVVLALVIFQCVFLGLSYVGIEHARQTNLTLVKDAFDQQKQWAEMLYNCTPNKDRPQ